jgi:hypothetical protein
MEIGMMCDHNIPFYAYGDNEAAVNMSYLLEQIKNKIDNINCEIFEINK